MSPKFHKEWTIHPFTCSMVTGMALRHKHMADSLGTLDSRGGGKIEGTHKSRFVNMNRKTYMDMDMSIRIFHQDLILRAILCKAIIYTCLSFILALASAHSNDIPFIRMYHSCLTIVLNELFYL